MIDTFSPAVRTPLVNPQGWPIPRTDEDMRARKTILVPLQSLTVGAQRAAKCQHLSATGNIQFGWMAQDLNSSGAVGDPSRATAEAGKEIVQAASANLIELIGEIGSFDLSALSDEGG